MSDKELKKENEQLADEEELVDEDLTGEIIELIDESDRVIKFRLLDVTEYKGIRYVLLTAAEPDDEFAEDEVVIFRLNTEQETLEPIEDEQLLQDVFDYYMAESETEDLFDDSDGGNN